MRIFYLPLEPYKSRYTVQLSRARTGWFERRLIDLGVDYVRVEGSKLSDDATIKAGVVLDACGRSYWSLTQIANLVNLINVGEVCDGDAVYLEDFWTPGFESLPYIRHLLGIDFRMYTLFHAQSVDTYDFTYPMRSWLRDFERGEAKELNGIFVTNTILKHLIEAAMLEPKDGIYVTGLPYASDEVLETAKPYDGPKEPLVVFTSRWDKEKDPEFFIHVVNYVSRRRPDIKFVATTSRPYVKSNEEGLESLAALSESDTLKFVSGLEKWEYYRYLQRAKVQFNCADQDFTSWTLLEATTFGCLPCYPNWRSFPETFRGRINFLYQKNNVADAGCKVIELVDAVPVDVSWIYKPFDGAAERMVNVMQGKKFEPLF